jgi:hypothetical protein
VLIEALVAETAVQAFDERVLDRMAWLNESRMKSIDQRD